MRLAVLTLSTDGRIFKPFFRFRSSPKPPRRNECPRQGQVGLGREFGVQCFHGGLRARGGAHRRNYDRPAQRCVEPCHGPHRPGTCPPYPPGPTRLPRRPPGTIQHGHQFGRRALLAVAGEAADIGKQHSDIAQLATQLQLSGSIWSSTAGETILSSRRRCASSLLCSVMSSTTIATPWVVWLASLRGDKLSRQS